MGNNGKQTYNTKYYNLDMIISIGFRVNSKKAINEYEKYRIIQDKNYVSDFDKLLIETKEIENK